MGYMHIDNLYKDQRILAFRECYAMEKIHGTSAHVTWRNGRLSFFSGGANSDAFNAIFDANALALAFAGKFGTDCLPVTIYGEAYGGKMQAMKDTYGPDLRFIAFEVQHGERFQTVEVAEAIARGLGFDFVPYRKVSTDIEALDAERDAPSELAKRLGVVGPDKWGNTPPIREGIVLRPPFEVRDNHGKRVMAKHKSIRFCETKTPRPVDPSALQVLADAERIADEWVTPMRLDHVADAVGAKGIEDTGAIIKGMVEDVIREAGAEIVDSKAARKAIGAAAAKLWRAQVTNCLHLSANVNASAQRLTGEKGE